MVAALLLGREGSVGFPGKNLYPVLGRPLAYYPMASARKAGMVDEVFLSTDSRDLVKLAEGLGISVINRPAALCTNEAKGADAFIHGYKAIRQLRKDKKIELMVLMFCNAPTVLPETIDEGIRVLRENPDYDSAVTVSKYNMWSPARARRIGGDGLLHPFVPFEAFCDPATLNCSRDSQGDVWFADVAVSVVRPACLEDMEKGCLPQKWMGQKIYPLKQWGGLDVDYEWQIPQAEYWLKKNGYGDV